MFDKFKDIMKMKKQMEDIKKELDSLTMDVENSFVKITITGSQEIKSVTLKGEPGSFKQDKLEDGIRDAVNKAVKESQKEAAKKMSSMSGLLGALGGN